MVFFFPSFWKVFLTNTSYGCPASKLSQSTLILGKGWNAPFPSPPCSGQVSRAQVSSPLPQMVALEIFRKIYPKCI